MDTGVGLAVECSTLWAYEGLRWGFEEAAGGANMTELWLVCRMGAGAAGSAGEGASAALCRLRG